MLERLGRAAARGAGYDLVPRQTAERDRALLDHCAAAAEARLRPLSPDIQARLTLLGHRLAPRRCEGHRKIRVGGARDGGYVMLDDFDRIRTAFSLGVGPNVEWDYEVAGRGIDIHQFDHTVAGPPRAHARFSFHKRRIDAVASADSENLASLLAAHGTPGASNLLKADIEGAEWALFADADPDDLARFPQIACEFHALGEVHDDAHYVLMMRALERLDALFGVIHVHANNFGGRVFVGDQAMPQFLEVTFANRRIYSLGGEAGPASKDLDGPNDPSRPDIHIGDFRFDVGDAKHRARLERLAALTPADIGFDPAAYLAANPDVAASGRDPWHHWRQSGWGEGRPMAPGDQGFNVDSEAAVSDIALPAAVAERRLVRWAPPLRPGRLDAGLTTRVVIRSLRLEGERHAIDAIAQARRRRPVREHVAEMAAAGRAMAFRPDHAVAAVLGVLDRPGKGIVEARPAGVALELEVRAEQRRPAADAGEGPGALLVQQGAGAGPLRAVTAHDLVLLGRQHGAPFGVGPGDGIGLGHVGSRMSSTSGDVRRAASPQEACDRDCERRAPPA